MAARASLLFLTAAAAIEVEPGALVARGKRIATVGTANGYYPDGVDVGSGYSLFPLNRLDPEKTLRDLAGAAPVDLSPSLLEAALAK